jgi:phage-related baseplate assembly protein
MIDLSLLQPPDVLEDLNYEAIYQQLYTQLIALTGEGWTAPLESDPVIKLLELAAYRELMLRVRVNEAAVSGMLAYATNADLNQLGANYEVVRLAGESDARFRARIQQGYHLLAAAGPTAAYRAHALGVSLDVQDVEVFSEAAGQVTLSVLGRVQVEAEGLAAQAEQIGTVLFGLPADANSRYVVAAESSALLLSVLSVLNAETVRPLTDWVVVRAPQIIPVKIEAVIEVLHGPDPEVILSRRLAALEGYLASVQRIGYDLTRAGIIAALVEAGVKNVRLSSPLADVVCGPGELAVVLGVQVTTEVVDA